MAVALQDLSRKALILLILAVGAVAATASAGFAQPTPFGRLAPQLLDVVPPSDRVSGPPGDMAIRQSSCRSLPQVALRRRIVAVAVQEWGFFGFNVVDQTRPDQTRLTATDRSNWQTRRRRRRLSPAESARVASSIAGYWTVTPQGGWILDEQNKRWTQPNGIAARWRYPWSAAFISWVMCESGLGDRGQFQRAVAHHVYIDQAIRARAADPPSAAFTAHDVGTVPITPGDLLCSARRPAYGSIAERQRQMGQGARTHCDIVVKLDATRERILAIGGNVGSSVSLKVLGATRTPDRMLSPVPGTRRAFAHLKLRADPIEPDAMDRTPTIQTLVCSSGPPARLADANLVAASTGGSRC